MKKLFLILAAIVTAITFSSCSKVEAETPEDTYNTDMPSDALACAFIDCAEAAMDRYYNDVYKNAGKYYVYYRWSPAKTWILVSLSGASIRLFYANYLFVNSLQDYQNGNHLNGEKYPNDDTLTTELHQDIPSETRNAVVSYLKTDSRVKKVSSPFAYIIDVDLK